jgi:endonuclease III
LAGELRELLVRDGNVELDRPRSGLVRFTGSEGPDSLLNDLTGHPHAFLFGCLVDRQVRAELAWRVPWTIRERLGSFAMDRIEGLTSDDWVRLMREPSPAHRLPETMAEILFRATERVVSQYGGDAGRIWQGQLSSAALVRRLLEFHGAGAKISTKAANILVREFKVPLSDYRYIDISADVQVLRVMARLGLVEQGADPLVTIYTARELNPDFPGVFDVALWRIGRDLCRPRNPRCAECRLRDLCQYGRAHLPRT